MEVLPQNWAEYIKSQPVLRMATVNYDGTAHVTPVWFVFDGHCFYIATDVKTKKLKNAHRNRKVSLVIDSYDLDNWDNVKGIMLDGMAEIVEKLEEVEKARKLLKHKYPAYAGKYSDWLDGRQSKSYAVIMKVSPFRYRFWTD